MWFSSDTVWRQTVPVFSVVNLYLVAHSTSVFKGLPCSFKIPCIYYFKLPPAFTGFFMFLQSLGLCPDWHMSSLPYRLLCLQLPSFRETSLSCVRFCVRNLLPCQQELPESNWKSLPWDLGWAGCPSAATPSGPLFMARQFVLSQSRVWDKAKIKLNRLAFSTGFGWDFSSLVCDIF